MTDLCPVEPVDSSAGGRRSGAGRQQGEPHHLQATLCHLQDTAERGGGGGGHDESVSKRGGETQEERKDRYNYHLVGLLAMYSAFTVYIHPKIRMPLRPLIPHL